MAKKTKQTQSLTKQSVAIYPGYGLVQGNYKVWLEKGDSKFQLQGLPTQVDADSVYIDSFEGPGKVELISSVYRGANLNPSMLQARALGNKVTLHFGSTVPAEQEQAKGRLLNLTGTLPNATAVLDVDGDVRIVPNVVGISLSELPAGLSATPSLAVNVVAEKKGWYQVRVLYKTGGLSWGAQAKWIYDEKASTIDWIGSVKVNNVSGAAYLQAMLKVVAGDAGNQYADGLEAVSFAAAAPAGGARGVVSKMSRQATVQNLGQVKVYSVPGLSNVEEGDRQTLPFLTRHGIPVAREYRVKPVWQWHAQGNRHEHEVRGLFLLKNDDAHKLNLAIPNQNVQVLQRDEDQDLLPSGGGWLPEAIVGEDMKLDAGVEFDLKATRIVKKIESEDGPTKTTGKKDAQVTTKKVSHTRDCVVELFNGKDHEVTFVVEEVLTEGTTFKGKNTLVEVAARQYETRVTVGAGKTESLEFTVVEVEEVEVETEAQTA